ncbi:MAG: hypothetical protein AAF810_26550 [Cyanobacteria bacterium P01_D01_bin.36]
MAVTQVKRKLRVLRNRAAKRRAMLKRGSKMPPIKQVDVEAIKKEFAQKKGDSAPATEANKEEAAE